MEWSEERTPQVPLARNARRKLKNRFYLPKPAPKEYSKKIRVALPDNRKMPVGGWLASKGAREREKEWRERGLWGAGLLCWQLQVYYIKYKKKL